MCKSYVYVIENISCNLCCYVGKANNPNERFQQHLYEIKDTRSRYTKSYFTNAIRKYGINNFILHIVEATDTEEQAFILEREWIDYLLKMGVKLYNRSPGGYGGEKRKTTEESKIKMSLSQKKRYESFELRKRISDKMKGKIKSSETCEKLSLLKRKSVTQFDINGQKLSEFESAKLAEEITGVSRSKICECCKGRRRKAGGCVWRYTSEL